MRELHQGSLKVGWRGWGREAWGRVGGGQVGSSGRVCAAGRRQVCKRHN